MDQATKPVKSKNTRTRSIILLSAVVFGAAIFFLVTQITGSATTTEVFERYFQPYYPDEELRLASEETTPKWKNGLDNFADGNYEKALEYFEYAEEEITYTTVEFYEGMSYLQMSHPDYFDAAYYLNEVQLEECEFQGRARWYYALTLIKQGNIKKARELLKTIVKERSYNHRSAQDILKMKIED
jgi:tetratricopeptide (TPR) repeat protein